MRDINYHRVISRPMLAEMAEWYYLEWHKRSDNYVVIDALNDRIFNQSGAQQKEARKLFWEIYDSSEFQKLTSAE